MQQIFGDDVLVAQARGGSVDAFAELVERHSAMAYRVALRMLGNHSDAQDLAQESLVAAWQNIARFRAESSFSTWLYRIVVRRALNRLARGRTHQSLDVCRDLATADPGPPAEAESHARSEAVITAVMTLPPAQRVVVVLHHLEGLTYDEVATVTGTSAASVRSHLYRARRALLDTLAQYAPVPA